jgi:hypothetical protein
MAETRGVRGQYSQGSDSVFESVFAVHQRKSVADFVIYRLGGNQLQPLAKNIPDVLLHQFKIKHMIVTMSELSRFRFIMFVNPMEEILPEVVPIGQGSARIRWRRRAMRRNNEQIPPRMDDAIPFHQSSNQVRAVFDDVGRQDEILRFIGDRNCICMGDEVQFGCHSGETHLLIVIYAVIDSDVAGVKPERVVGRRTDLEPLQAVEPLMGKPAFREYRFTTFACCF